MQNTVLLSLRSVIIEDKCKDLLILLTVHGITSSTSETETGFQRKLVAIRILAIYKSGSNIPNQTSVSGNPPRWIPRD